MQLSAHPNFGAVHDGDADVASGDMDLGGTPEPVVVGDGQRLVLQLGRNGDEIVRMRGPVEEAVVRVSMKLCVSCHPVRLIERMFALHGVTMSTRIGGMDDDLTPEEIEQIRRRRMVRAAIAVAIVIAMVATLLFPVIVRVVRPTRSPDVVIAIHAGTSWRRMSG